MNELKKLLEDPTASILFLTGAGVSTPSGIPDFKTQSANWKFEKTREEVISIGFFRAKPERFWEIYPSVFGNYQDAKPNAFHKRVAELQHKYGKVTVATQNIDGLDRAAGVKNVIELHGNARELICVNKRCRTGPVPYLSHKDFGPSGAPLCTSCGKILKPNVVLFGEDIKGFKEAKTKAATASIIVVAGTALDVYPANTLASGYVYGQVKVWYNKTTAPKHFKFDVQLKDDVVNLSQYI